MLKVALRDAALEFKFGGVLGFLYLTIGNSGLANHQAFLNHSALSSRPDEEKDAPCR